MISRKLICITGMDGSGKSTLIEGMKERLGPVYLSTIWDLLNDPVKGIPFKSKKDIDDFLCGLTPGSRLLFLAHAMKYSIDKALESNNNIILIDSYYYKYFASEKALGADDNLIISLQQAFPEPDIVIELTLTLEDVLKRKKFYSRYECGLSDHPGKDPFISFQKKVTEAWKLFNTHNWRRIDAGNDAAVVLQETLTHLL